MFDRAQRKCHANTIFICMLFFHLGSVRFEVSAQMVNNRVSSVLPTNYPCASPITMTVRVSLSLSHLSVSLFLSLSLSLLEASFSLSPPPSLSVSLSSVLPDKFLASTIIQVIGVGALGQTHQGFGNLPSGDCPLCIAHTHTATRVKHAYVQTRIYTYMYTYIHTYKPTYIHPCIHAYLHTCIPGPSYIHIYIQVCRAHTYMHTCMH